MMSPAYASSARTRLPAMKVTASVTFICLPRRMWRMRMPWRVATRTDPQEGDPVPMPWIHVRLDLKHEPRGKALRPGQRHDPPSLVHRGGGACSTKWSRHSPDTEVAKCGSEEHRRSGAFEKRLSVEGMTGTLDKFDPPPRTCPWSSPKPIPGFVATQAVLSTRSGGRGHRHRACSG